MLPGLYIANWKMHMRPEEVKNFGAAFADLLTPRDDGFADAGIAPPFTSLPALRDVWGSNLGLKDINLRIGAQNVHWLGAGAHTGEISIEMLQDFSASFAIVGHSERRQFYGENSADVAKRAKAAIGAGLTAVVCIGESQAEFEAGRSAEVVATLLAESLDGIDADDVDRLVVAYEPIWAIGTGHAATPEIAANIHDQIRAALISKFGEAKGAGIYILYGGSTKPENIEELMSQHNINGALVGGASLKPDTFAQLIINGRKGNEKT